MTFLLTETVGSTMMHGIVVEDDFILLVRFYLKKAEN